MNVEGRTIYTFSRETRGRFFSNSYSDLPDKNNMLWRNTGHSFLRIIIHLHPTRIQKHLLACKHTCGTTAAFHKAGSGTDSMCSWYLSSANKPAFWSWINGVPTVKLLTSLSLGDSLGLDLRLLRQGYTKQSHTKDLMSTKSVDIHHY